MESDIYGESNAYEFKYRVHDARIGRFLSVDPIAKEYPWNSTYAFAENRVIDGIDLEGKEWSRSVGPDGKTNNISVNANFYVSNDLPLMINITKYQQAINEEFNLSLSTSTNNQIHGQVTFNSVKESTVHQIVPSIEFYSRGKINEKGQSTGASTTFSGVVVPLFDKNGILKSPKKVGLSVVHELAHTLGVQHPFAYTQQSLELELIKKADGSFSTTPNTAPNINSNLMMYNFQTVNGQCLEPYTQNQLTTGQIKVMENQIDNQINGAGSLNLRNKNDYYNSIDNGTPVKKEGQ